ncbi:MAG: hypothetical protein AAF193_09435, partial [Bacteroidota bacterium]
MVVAFPTVQANRTSYPALEVKTLLREMHDFSFYSEQATAWKKILDEDPKDQYAWYNYYLANRYGEMTINGLGTGTPHENLVQEIIERNGDFMSVESMLKRLDTELPNSFIRYYIEAAAGERTLPQERYLELITKAHELNPHFAEIYDGFVTHYELVGDSVGRKYFNEMWYQSNDYSQGMLSYYYNVLMTLEENAIYLTYGD